MVDVMMKSSVSRIELSEYHHMSMNEMCAASASAATMNATV